MCFLTCFWASRASPPPPPKPSHISITILFNCLGKTDLSFIFATVSTSGSILARVRKSFPKILGSILEYYISMELWRNCITFGDLGSSVKIILGSTRKYCTEAGEILGIMFMEHALKQIISHTD